MIFRNSDPHRVHDEIIYFMQRLFATHCSYLVEAETAFKRPNSHPRILPLLSALASVSTRLIAKKTQIVLSALHGVKFCRSLEHPILHDGDGTIDRRYNEVVIGTGRIKSR